MCGIAKSLTGLFVSLFALMSGATFLVASHPFGCILAVFVFRAWLFV